MKHLAEFIVEHKKIVLSFFLLLTLITGLLIPLVKINYDLLDYLPAKAPSTKALEAMNKEFTAGIPNARVMVKDLSLAEALQMKDKLKQIYDVKEVLWLDDQTDIYQPEAFLDQDLLTAYYKDGTALYQLTADTTDVVRTVKEIQDLIGPENSVSGQIVELAKVQQSTISEIVRIMAIMLPLGILLLMLTTRNYIEPLLLLVTISIAIVLNMGTNLMFGNISFLTQSVSAVLQMAVSLDYAIFLLHRFNDYKQEGLEHKAAMKAAIRKSIVAIASSAMTTFLGFLVLVFMQFQIGPDLGLVLAKGILFSLVTVVGLLPVLVLLLERWIEKATHRSLLPSFDGLARFITKYHRAFLLILMVTVIAFLAQSKNDFLYGNNATDMTSRESRDTVAINEAFGKESQIVILVPRGADATEKVLVDEIRRLPHVKAVVSYSTSVGMAVPEEVLASKDLSLLRSQHYSRIIVFHDLADEGTEPFHFVEELKNIIQKAYPEGLMTGQLPSVYDMKVVTEKDNVVVNGLSILTIGLVILIAFRSLAIPLILLLTIETSIWLNLSIPYFSGSTLSYIGYLIISSVQLGATVDYGILFSQHYLDNRRLLPKDLAVQKTIAEVIAPLLPPALILTLAGVILGQVSSLQVVSELGNVLGRGAILSLTMVIFLLPSLMMLFDRFVEKTTKGAPFVSGERSHR